MDYYNLIWSTFLIASFWLLNGIDCILHGDKVTDIDQFKYVAAIKIRKGSYSELCGGSILNDFLILTAAHCFYDQSTKEFVDKVIVRAHTLKNVKSYAGIERKVEEIYMLKRYVNNVADDDIAIVKVRKSLNLFKNSHKLQAVDLPRVRGLTATDNQEATIAGYGVYQFDKKDEPVTDKKLRTLEVETVPNRICNKPKAQSSPNMYICAKPSGSPPGSEKGFCHGDSGGPLVIKHGDRVEIIGVIAENDDKCDDTVKPGLYMRVSNYLDSFINKVMNDDIDRDTIHVLEMTDSQSCVP